MAHFGEKAMEIRIRLRKGDVEVEYGGPQGFLEKQLQSVIDAASAIARACLVSGSDRERKNKDEENSDGDASPIRLGMNSVAQKMAVKSGKDLVLAACASLTLIDKKKTFNRADLLSSMKKASHYYKKSFNNNLSSYLSRLVKAGKILEPSDGKYSLHATTAADLRAKLE